MSRRIRRRVEGADALLLLLPLEVVEVVEVDPSCRSR
jgi:hypothetical protein